MIPFWDAWRKLAAAVKARQENRDDDCLMIYGSMHPENATTDHEREMFYFSSLAINLLSQWMPAEEVDRMIDWSVELEAKQRKQ